MRRSLILLGLVALLLPVSGCLGPTYQSEIQPPIALPDSYANGADRAEMPPDKWWEAFGDAELNATMELVFEDNLQYRAAWARIEQMEAVRDMAASGWWPQVDGSVGVGRSKSGGSPLGAIEQNSFQAQLAAGYEIDVWGKVRASVYAAEQDIEALKDDAQAIAMTLAAQVVQTWFDVVRERERRTLVEEQIALSELFYELVVLRLQVGQATALDVYEQEQQLEALRSQLTLMDAREQAALSRLAILLGKTPGTVAGPSTEVLPDVPAATAAGVPADLLERRPDIRAAYRRAEAANARIVVAIADQLPSVRLSASLSLFATSPGDLLDDLFWSIAASIAGPIFDGGRRSAEVERTKAVLDERILNYGQVLLQAAQEVEEAMIMDRQQEILIQQLEQQVTTATAVLDTSQRQFQRGVSDYFRVLRALNGQLSLESQLIDARYQRLLFRVSLYRALGGRWTEELKKPGREEEDE